MQQRHFLKRSGKNQNYTKTDRSAISLRVAAKTRTKPTGAPSTVYRTNMPRWRIADSIRYIRDLLAKQNPTLLSWPICLSIDLMLIITPLGGNTKTLSRPIPTCPSASVGTGWNETAGKTTTFTRGLLRNQRFSISRKIRRYIRERNRYSIVDMKDIRYTIRQGRYSDKQTTKRSFPIPALV